MNYMRDNMKEMVLLKYIATFNKHTHNTKYGLT